MKRTITIEPDNAGVSAAIALTLFAELEALNGACALEKFSFERTAASPPTFVYTFKAIDGRTWKQVLVMNPADNPSMTFGEVTGSWHDSEFIPHRPLRDTAVQIARDYPTVTLVRCTFGA